MPERDLIIDSTAYDLDHVIADQSEILRYIPQRHEMLQLSAIVHDDKASGISVGYCDIGPDKFWVRGHMPGTPLMPGVLMCEAAAQLSTYHAQRHQLMQAEMIGFGGLDNVRFREVVVPGDRLVVVVQKLAVRPTAMMRSRFQCLVDKSVACEGEIRGVPIRFDAIRRGKSV